MTIFSYLIVTQFLELNCSTEHGILYLEFIRALYSSLPTTEYMTSKQ